jgi:glyoxylase-like metal-dependent hydrolase (beta-lactamase superfamily II)
LALDDEVALLDARGHTAGHVAVLVRGVSGWWLHAGDAAYGIGEIEGRGASPLAWVLAWSRRLLSETHATLRATRAAATGPRLVLSHDSEAFALLPKLARGGGDGPGSTEVRSRDLSP